MAKMTQGKGMPPKGMHKMGGRMMKDSEMKSMMSDKARKAKGKK